MTPGQIEQFRQQGCLHVPGAVDGKTVARLRVRILEDLKRQGIWAGGRSQSRALRELPVFQQTGRLGQLLHDPRLHEALLGPGLLQTIKALVDFPLKPALEAQLLLSLPHGRPWTLQGLNWHRDVGRAALGSLPGVQVFYLLDDLAHGGGGTLVLAGSHHLKEPTRAIAQAAQLDAGSLGKPWVLQETELRVLEMTGRAGDVYLMDMRLLHTPAVNASRGLRMMATTRHHRA